MMTDGKHAKPHFNIEGERCMYAKPEYIPYEGRDATCDIHVQVHLSLLPKQKHEIRLIYSIIRWSRRIADVGSRVALIVFSYGTRLV